MKKFLISVTTLCLFLTLITSLFSCSNNQSQYYGTWKATSVEINGVVFTIDELEEMGDDSLSDFRIEIKPGNKAYVFSEGEGVYVKWEISENKIKIGIRECFIEDGKLVVQNNSTIKIYLSKQN